MVDFYDDEIAVGRRQKDVVIYKGVGRLKITFSRLMTAVDRVLVEGRLRDRLQKASDRYATAASKYTDARSGLAGHALPDASMSDAIVAAANELHLSREAYYSVLEEFSNLILRDQLPAHGFETQGGTTETA